MSSSGEREGSAIQIEHEPAEEEEEAGVFSHAHAASFSSQPSLRSLPSLGPHNASVSPCFHRCVDTLAGHSSYVSALAVDGGSLYTASSDGSIKLWSLLGGARRRQEEEEEDERDASGGAAVMAVASSSAKWLLAIGDGDGRRLMSSHQDGKIRAWRVARRRDDGAPPRLVLLAVLPTAVDRLRACFFPWNYVEIRRHRRRTWVHHVDAVTALAASPDGELLYSASWDRSLKVWRVAGFRCVESIPAAHDDAINALAVSPDGHVYTGSADRKIKAWRRDPRRGKHALVWTAERHRSAVNALALGGAGGREVLYSGACDRSVIVWELVASGDGDIAGGGGRMEATGTLRGHAKAILCLAAAAEVVCSGSADRTARVWRRGADKGYTCLAVLEGHGAAVKCLELVRGGVANVDGGSCSPETERGSSSDGGSCLVCTGALDGDVKIWSVLLPCTLRE